MRILVTVVTMMACSGRVAAVMTDPGADAHLLGVHDQLVLEKCDESWSTEAVTATGCEHACLVPPVVEPCRGAMPCNDGGACAARDQTLKADCAATFTATDDDGEHQGCCIGRTDPAFPGRMIPSFFECVPGGR
jgi:hypothetical protein